MTHLEINKKIAELKGLIQVSEVMGLLKPTNEIQHTDMFDGVLCSANKNWAESIADAWDLFEEMPEAEIRNVEKSIGLIGVKYECTYVSAAHAGWGESAPLAICAAWLKWKENSSS